MLINLQIAPDLDIDFILAEISHFLTLWIKFRFLYSFKDRHVRRKLFETAFIILANFM